MMPQAEDCGSVNSDIIKWKSGFKLKYVIVIFSFQAIYKNKNSQE